MTHTPASLIAFRDRVAAAFADKQIRSPVHFPGGQESQIIEAMKDFRPGVDWLATDWRNMYRCLLAGMPEDELFQQILEGRSMYIMSAKRRILCSSIVGGILPVACGLAMGIKRRGGPERVWVVIGDMTATTGLFYEFWNYAGGFSLPVVIIVEDNGLSTNAPTAELWEKEWQPLNPREFKYTRTMPHVGLAQRVSF